MTDLMSVTTTYLPTKERKPDTTATALDAKRLSSSSSTQPFYELCKKILRTDSTG